MHGPDGHGLEEPRASVTQLLDDDSVLSVCLPRSPQTSPCVCEREKQVLSQEGFCTDYIMQKPDGFSLANLSASWDILTEITHF